MGIIAIPIIDTQRGQFPHISEQIIKLFKLICLCIRQGGIKVNLEMFQRMAALEDVSQDKTM